MFKEAISFCSPVVNLGFLTFTFLVENTIFGLILLVEAGLVKVVVLNYYLLAGDYTFSKQLLRIFSSFNA